MMLPTPGDYGLKPASTPPKKSDGFPFTLETNREFIHPGEHYMIYMVIPFPKNSLILNSFKWASKNK
jgi:hypothetical protein